MKTSETVYIGVGSNLGDSLGNCINAAKLLNDTSSIQSVVHSPWYKTEPFGHVQQDWFINGVFKIQTSLTPVKLLELCQSIEQKMQRVQTITWGPRTLDLDILLWKGRTFCSNRLRIPHPWLHLRRFVLQPFCDLDPDIIHPFSGLKMKDLLAVVQDDLSVIPLSETMENL